MDEILNILKKKGLSEFGSDGSSFAGLYGTGGANSEGFDLSSLFAPVNTQTSSSSTTDTLAATDPQTGGSATGDDPSGSNTWQNAYDEAIARGLDEVSAQTAADRAMSEADSRMGTALLGLVSSINPAAGLVASLLQGNMPTLQQGLGIVGPAMTGNLTSSLPGPLGIGNFISSALTGQTLLGNVWSALTGSSSSSGPMGDWGEGTFDAVFGTDPYGTPSQGYYDSLNPADPDIAAEIAATGGYSPGGASSGYTPDSDFGSWSSGPEDSGGGDSSSSDSDSDNGE